jgi:hypothetical protein
VSYKRQELPTLSKHLSLPPVFYQFVLFILFQFSVLYFCFDCLRPASCVPNVTGVSGPSILDCPFGFSNVYLLQYHLTLSDTPFVLRCFCLFVNVITMSV